MKVGFLGGEVRITLGARENKRRRTIRSCSVFHRAMSSRLRGREGGNNDAYRKE